MGGGIFLCKGPVHAQWILIGIHWSLPFFLVTDICLFYTMYGYSKKATLVNQKEAERNYHCTPKFIRLPVFCDFAKIIIKIDLTKIKKIKNICQ